MLSLSLLYAATASVLGYRPETSVWSFAEGCHLLLYKIIIACNWFPASHVLPISRRLTCRPIPRSLEIDVLLNSPAGLPLEIWFYYSVFLFGGQEVVCHSFSFFAHFVFLRVRCVRTQSAAVASRRATNLATHLLTNFSTHIPTLSHPSPYQLSHPSPGLIFQPFFWFLSRFSWVNKCHNFK